MFRTRWTAWIASLAILLGALAPMAAWRHAGASRLPSALLEVCGSRMGSAPILKLRAAPDASDAPSGTMQMAHCQLCVMHADALGLPPDNAAMAIPLAPGDAPATPILDAPAPQAVWTAALARAPPLALS